MKKVVFQVIVFLFSTFYASIAAASYLIADLSAHNILLDYNFKGQYITVSGIIDQVEDIVISVEGPVRAYRVWKKEKVRGIWVNSKSFTIPFGVSYSYIAASRNLYEISDISTLRSLNLDYKYENYEVEEKYLPQQVNKFKEEFRFYRQALMLYPSKVGNIERIGDNIFRAKFYIPEYAFAGQYEVNVYAFSQGKMIQEQKVFFEARKQGLYAKIDEISHTKPLQYALIAVIIALSAGAIAGFLFRKDR